MTFFQGDLYDKEIRKKALELGPYDSVICDAAPKTTGNKVVDQAGSSGLVELAIFYAEQMLKPGGKLIYSTCTFAPIENEQTIAAFMEKYPEYEILPLPIFGGIT